MIMAKVELYGRLLTRGRFIEINPEIVLFR
jgi:hypothetical protein